VLVVDASVVAPAVADSGDEGARIRHRLRGESLAGPDVLRVEAMSVIRRAAVNGSLSAAQARRAVDDLLDIPLVVYPATPLLRRAWSLRNNLTPYDACYVALAEALGCPLLTADARLANAPGSRCSIELV
jgi:predicted nucleic acid-binding protein